MAAGGTGALLRHLAETADMSTKLRNVLVIVGPGILVAATGVGAGDLATASFTGSLLGLTVLWAVVLGAFLKYVLNEGLARWQLATGDTLLEGSVERFGRPVQWVFLCYLVIWSFLVGAALMSAVGVTCHAMLPLFGEDKAGANADKILYGVLHSALAVILVKVGGYRLFEKVMRVCIAVMFVVVVVTAVALLGHARPATPPIDTYEAVTWTVALMGGVGGTLTVLCYGYWIREEGRQGAEELKTCRIDLATGYAMTAIFGLAMVVIGSRLETTGAGAKLFGQIAVQLEGALGTMGPIAKWAFLLGAWGAVFSSLLGVWQSMPYLFADFWSLRKHGRSSKQAYRVDTKSLPYQLYLFGIALVPVVGLVAVDFITIQKTYAVVGALFIPMLAFALLVLNGRVKWVGARYKNSFWTSLVLIGTLLFFIFAGGLAIYSKLFAPPPRMDRLQPAPPSPHPTPPSRAGQFSRSAILSIDDRSADVNDRFRKLNVVEPYFASRYAADNGLTPYGAGTG
jgi:Mn2+/Fe2+ NRAMP family transporter